MNDIAIVGVGCRLPGGIRDLAGLWAALSAGRDLVTRVPPDRFDRERFVASDPRRPGKTYTGSGGFLDDIAGFDAAYFGISPREASRMDPQQRLMLEMAVEALDDAGIDPTALAGSQTGVYVGASTHDYEVMQVADPAGIDAYTNAGISPGNIANRVSHALDLHGPSMSIDTACSSALVAFHQAAEFIRCGEHRLALAGGVNILISPYPYIGFAKASMLSPRGRCHAFSAEADGYVRAEGGGFLLLKSLPDAVADGDRIHAVVLGTGANADGRTSGLSLPNPRAQELLLRGVYGEAGVAAEELVYFEAHGTGTQAGDPIECEAIGRALASGRDRPLPIGSVKTNLGHLEAASGVAGILKAVLVLRHGLIPPSLHGEPPNPRIDFDTLRLVPVTRARPVDERGPRSVVGVNSFGFGGANAHTILSAPPASPPRPAPAHRTLPVMVSAQTGPALAEAARRLEEYMSSASDEEFYDICYTACRRRGRRSHRAVVMAGSPAEAAEGLSNVAAGTPAARSAIAVASPRGRVAFVFSGNGSQWAGMAADLLEADPAFRAAVDAVDAAISPRLGWSVAEELAAPAERSRLTLTEVAQPALFAVQVGLLEALRVHGIRPQATVGHSVGEIAAAYAAGALDLRQAAQVVAERSAAQAPTAGLGRMAAAGLSPDQAGELLRPYGGCLEVAAVNSGRDVTICGDPAGLTTLGEELAARDVFFRPLDLDYAFHSRVMDRAEDAIRAGLAGLRPTGTRIPFISTVTGEEPAGEKLDADYWWRNIRHPVLFAPAVRRLLEREFDVLVEIGPHSVLSTYLKRIGAERDAPVTVVPTLRRGGDGPADLGTAVATSMAAGARLDWEEFFPHPGRVTGLPAYPWQHEPQWNGGAHVWARPLDHPLLGERLPLMEPAWQGRLEPERLPWLTDHKIENAVIMPGAGYIEMALAAGRRALGGPVEVIALRFPTGLVLTGADETKQTQVTLSDEDGLLRIASRSGRDTEWRLHARGRVRRLHADAPARSDLNAIRARSTRHLDHATCYSMLKGVGFHYGPAFEVLRDVWTGHEEALGSYVLNVPQTGYEAHPTLLDGALQTVIPLLTATGRRFLPVSVGAVKAWRDPAPWGFAHTRLTYVSQREAEFDVTITDDTGEVAVLVQACRVRQLPRTTTIAIGRYVTELRAASVAGEAARPSPRPGSREPAAAPREPTAESRGPTAESRGPAAESGGPTAAIEAMRETWALASDDSRARASKCRDLTAHFTARAFTRLLPNDRVFDVPTLLAAGVLPKYTRLIKTLAAIAETCGLFTREEASGLLTTERDADGRPRWHLVAEPEPEAFFQALFREFPGHSADLILRGRCGRHLDQVLCGRVDPMDLIFPDGGAHTIEHLHDGMPGRRLDHRIAQAVLRETAKARPSGHPLRVLEIGGGTGGITAALLPALPPDRIQYVFTDRSEVFLRRAAARFEPYDFVEYRELDLTEELSAQGFAEQAFDLVVAAGSLHAAPDVRDALRRIVRLLAPGGHLLALEHHDGDDHAPIFGLLDDWWAFTDTEFRGDSPLLTAGQWIELLRECGYAEVTRLGADDDPEHAASSLLLAGSTEHISPQPARIMPAPGTSWILMSEQGADDSLASAVASALCDAGTSPAVMPAAVPDVHQWPAAVRRGDTCVAIVLLLGDISEGDPPSVAALTGRRAQVVRSIASARGELPAGVSVRLWLVTPPTGLHPAPETPRAPAAAALWGVTRSLANERPDMEIRRISLERGADDDHDARLLVREVLDPSDEDEIVLTGNGRFVPRLTPARAPTRPVGVTDGVPFKLRLDDQGPGYRLTWEQTGPAGAVGAHEILVAVRAAALNYRDVLWARGLLPEEAVQNTFFGPHLGIECAGIVTEVGPAVTRFKPGDHVFVPAAGSLSSHVVAMEAIAGHIPEGMDFTDAATLPIAFTTAHYALDYLARLAPHETVLVHGAAGGVGLAALQHARHVGAQVIGTAGTPEKRDLLRLLDVMHTVDSRSPRFADEIRELTGGVDVVLNSLAGEAIPRGLELLRSGGRFVELGKLDLYGDSSVSLRPFRDNLRMLALNLDQALLYEPRLWADQVERVTRLVHAGAYRPIANRVYPPARVAEAFRLLQHSRHIGKVIISFDEPIPIERKPEPVRLDPQGTYLVTGGLGGFGAAAAVRLAQRGARHLALVSRTGPDAPEAQATVRALREQGATPTAYAADVTDTAAMQAVLDRVDRTGHPLRGVVHAAMALDDASLEDLTPERFQAALAPKMTGALVLDRLTRERELDLFVLLSSFTTVIGNAIQSNYVAANLFLEALARARRREGLPACAIALGLIGETGYASRSPELMSFLTRFLPPLSPGEALDALDDQLAQGMDVAASGRVAWAETGEYLPALKVPRLAGVLPNITADQAGQADEALRHALTQGQRHQAHAFITEAITKLVAGILHTTPERLDPTRPLNQLGLDSLMATELVSAIRQRFGCVIPALEVIGADGLAHLAELVHAQLARA